MRPHELMLDFGRPVAYYPGLVRHLGSVNAVIFFAQIFYWQDKAASEHGVYKTAQEIEEETGLSYREQATARQHLRKRGILIETHRRLDHRIYYLIDLDVLDSVLSTNSASDPRTTKAQFGDDAKRNPGSDKSAVREPTKAQFVIQEITSEITTENNPPLSPQGEQAERSAAGGDEQGSGQDATGDAVSDERGATDAGVKTKPSKRATALPDGFQPADTHRELADSLGVNLSAEWPQFVDYHRAKGSTFKDWSAALRTWIRNAAKFGGRTGQQQRRTYFSGSQQRDYRKGVNDDGSF